MPLSISMKEIGLSQVVERYRGSPVVLQVALNDTLRSIGRLILPILKNNTPRGATGRLRNFTVFQVDKGQRLVVRQSARSQSNFFYGSVVRRGSQGPRRMPPTEALIPWVMAKWGLAGPAAVSGAWRLALSIKKKGTRTNRYDITTMQQARPGIVGVVQQLAARLRREI